ncbi:DUF6274 family protein [Streptomyces sp. WMMC1477]|uniref:DUF6274 family protein n=1 Tax=Streptomyces sp. WMMC1477 TaxID=3015155 RepID=UPI0022B6639C|nr:DUF6274 family protein [Streptomyces sp. WMMC1477]MCZ7432244.1 DUF6274 family protein [Streptomyces sp. WMMC1477]
MGMTEGGRRHETAALLRAHLSAAARLPTEARYRHVTRLCPVCHRILLLAQEGSSQRAWEAVLVTNEAQARQPSPAPETDPPRAADAARERGLPQSPEGPRAANWPQNPRNTNRPQKEAEPPPGNDLPRRADPVADPTAAQAAAPPAGPAAVPAPDPAADSVPTPDAGPAPGSPRGRNPTRGDG